MMQLSIMRRIKFCAGHRLLGHEGKCRHFHGHNYVADFHVSGSQQDAVGRVIDFSLLKTKLKGWLDDHWDHAMVLWEADENAIAAAQQVQPSRIYELPYNPTAENMARYLLEVAAPVILAGTGAQATKVVLWESDECFAEVSLIEAPQGEVMAYSSAEQV
jgi:6-pyruvoyltetrahydropterin/6-carboxytetrahydropterin synthase